MIISDLHAGLLLPESFMHSQFFVILATLVALNTVIYAALSIVHILPKWFRSSWLRGRRTRKVTRSIYPDAPK
ncbi:MAG: hypothetical protein RLZZ380_1000 [Actinomycetota bacterium]|jgi:hypothetical protein